MLPSHLLEAPETLLPAYYRQQLVDRLRHGAAGQGDSDRLHDVSQLGGFVFSHLLQGLEQAIRISSCRIDALECCRRQAEIASECGAHLLEECLALGVEGGASGIQPHRDLLGNMENGARTRLH